MTDTQSPRATNADPEGRTSTAGRQARKATSARKAAEPAATKQTATKQTATKQTATRRTGNGTAASATAGSPRAAKAPAPAQKATAAKRTPAKSTAAKSTAAKSTAAKSTAAKSTAAKSTAAQSTAGDPATPTSAVGPAEASIARIRQLNERAILATRNAGQVAMEAYQSMLQSMMALEQKRPGATPLEAFKTMVAVQTDFAQSIAKAYLSAARSILR